MTGVVGMQAQQTKALDAALAEHQAALAAAKVCCMLARTQGGRCLDH